MIYAGLSFFLLLWDQRPAVFQLSGLYCKLGRNIGTKTLIMPNNVVLEGSRTLHQTGLSGKTENIIMP